MTVNRICMHLYRVINSIIILAFALQSCFSAIIQLEQTPRVFLFSALTIAYCRQKISKVAKNCGLTKIQRMIGLSFVASRPFSLSLRINIMHLFCQPNDSSFYQYLISKSQTNMNRQQAGSCKDVHNFLYQPVIAIHPCMQISPSRMSPMTLKQRNIYINVISPIMIFS